MVQELLDRPVMRYPRELELASGTGRGEQTQKPRGAIFANPALVVLLFVVSFFLNPLMETFVARANGQLAQGAEANHDNGDPTFDKMPEGWRVINQIVISAPQLNQFSQKLGGTITYANNTVISDSQRQLQINVLKCPTEKDADGVYQSLLKLNRNAQHLARNGTTIFEFICRTSQQAKFAAEARYLLPILPPEAKYRVKFDVVPLADFDAMSWNKLYNLFLRWDAAGREGNADRASIEAEIESLSKQFPFGDTVTLRNTGLGITPTSWQFSPQPADKTLGDSAGVTSYRFENLPRRAGMPVVGVEAIVTSKGLATTPVVDDASRQKSLSANAQWPADAAEIRRLAAEITEGASTEGEKVEAILRWFADEQNIRFGAPVLGSRYGTEQVLKQKFGQCWDYSDVFITFCRASGIPARQVIGWLHNGPGHVWAEVAMDGRWHPVDPTGGSRCGSDYLPFVISDDAKLSYVYASPVQIQLLQAK